jgi:hypothetical protein
MFSVASPSLTHELFTIGIFSGHLPHPSKLTILNVCHFYGVVDVSAADFVLQVF